MEIVKADKPGQRFAEVLVLTEEVLGVIGDMGVAHAQILQNHARRLIFPLLGFKNNYEQPKLAISDLNNNECQEDANEAGV